MQQQNLVLLSEHYDFLDILKAVAIFFVILYHSFTASSYFLGNPGWMTQFHYFCKSILSACVPIFFLVNGALILNRPFHLKKHLRKTGKLFLLATIWGVIDVVVLMFLRGEYLSLKESVLAICYLKSGWCTHLWFLYTLVMVYFFVPVLKQAFDTNRAFYRYFLIICVAFTIGKKLLSMGVTVSNILFGDNLLKDLLYFLDRVNPLWGINGFALAYFMIGGSLFDMRDKLQTRRIRIIAAASIPVLLFFWYFYAFRVSRYYGKMVDIVYDGYGTPFIFLYTIALFILALPYRRRGKFGVLVQSISSNTLGIYLIQTTAIPLFSPLVADWRAADSVLFSCAFAAAILLVCLLTCLLMKRIPVVKYLFRI